MWDTGLKLPGIGEEKGGSATLRITREGVSQELRNPPDVFPLSIRVVSQQSK